MNILGISALYHDSAACLLQDGIITAAVQEERLTRRKFEPNFPVNSIQYCLEFANLKIEDIDCIAFYEDPKKKMERILWSIGQGIGDIHPILNTWDEKMGVEFLIRKHTGFDGEIKMIDHHISHAASSFFMSGFEDAALFVVDGVGEWATTTFATGKGKEIQVIKEIEFPNSLGLYYSAITSFLGFRPNSDEYKVMGMTAYGSPLFVDQLKEMIDWDTTGNYTLDMSYFNYNSGMFSDKFEDVLKVRARKYGEKMEQVHFDIACSAQKILEEILLASINWLYKHTGLKKLCLSGGVALNCLANGHLRNNSLFEEIFVQPASGDAGTCFGAALAAYASLAKEPHFKAIEHVRLGPQFNDKSILQYVTQMDLKAKEFSTSNLIYYCAEKLSEGKIIGWFQGRMEFGPRALGGRSILADPRSISMKERLNILIKKREEFRPFAPISTEEDAPHFFDIDRNYPFMTFIVESSKGNLLEAVTHDDGTARLQTVNKNVDPLMHQLLSKFGELTGVPVLLNTSFNVAGEPIVCSPSDAFNCFRESGIDILVMGSYVIERNEQLPELMEPGTLDYQALAREVEPYLKDTYFFS